jgi:hypothetical protein
VSYSHTLHLPGKKKNNLSFLSHFESLKTNPEKMPLAHFDRINYQMNFDIKGGQEMTCKPNKDAEEYFRVRTVWPRIIYTRRRRKVAENKAKGRSRKPSEPPS